MDGNDRMEIDPVALLGVDTTVTVGVLDCGRCRGLPANTTLFEGRQRVPTSAK